MSTPRAKDFFQAVIDRLPDDMSANLNVHVSGCFATVYHKDEDGYMPCALLDEFLGDMTVGWYDQNKRITPSDDPDVVAMYVMLLVERQSTMSDRELRAFNRKYSPDS